MKLLGSLKLILSIHCREASHLASDSVDRELAWDERIALCLHTLICAPCRRCLKQLRAIRDVISGLPDKWPSRDIAGPHLGAARRQQIKRLLAEANRSEVSR